MRIHKIEKIPLARLTIKAEKENTEYINLAETTHQETIQFLVREFSQYSFKTKDTVTTIDARYCLGGENGKSQRVTLYGIKPKAVIEKINKILT